MGPTRYQLYEERGLRWSDGRPEAAIARTFYDEMHQSGRRASTLASAIEINRPVNLKKALRSLEFTQGVGRRVSDQEILDAKAQVGAGGFGCEPASAASVAGVRALRAEGVIAASDRVVCILTGHQLKDPTTTVAYHANDAEQFKRVLGQQGVHSAPYANNPIQVENDLGKIMDVIRGFDDRSGFNCALRS